jgi:FeS assembly SUF system regulator
MLRISKLADYAIIIVSLMAHKSQLIQSAAQVAAEINLRLPTVSKILKLLSTAQLVTAHRGTGGGYQLARAAQEITLAQIVIAIEGSLAMTECCSSEILCSLDAFCSIKENWKTINKLILTTLGSLTLADMMRPLNVNALTLKGIPITVQGLNDDK